MTFYDSPSGMFQEFKGMNAHFEPKELASTGISCRNKLSCPHPLATVFFVDYQRVAHCPFTITAIRSGLLLSRIRESFLVHATDIQAVSIYS